MTSLTKYKDGVYNKAMYLEQRHVMMQSYAWTDWRVTILWRLGRCELCQKITP